MKLTYFSESYLLKACSNFALVYALWIQTEKMNYTFLIFWTSSWSYKMRLFGSDSYVETYQPRSTNIRGRCVPLYFVNWTHYPIPVTLSGNYANCCWLHRNIDLFADYMDLDCTHHSLSLSYGCTARPVRAQLVGDSRAAETSLRRSAQLIITLHRTLATRKFFTTGPTC